jgi:ketosteroid isomerase-like protein
MESANLELVRSIRAAWERGDYSSAKWAHPDIEFVIADGPAPGRWTGLAGMAQGFRSFVSAWEEFHAEADEYRELKGDHVLVLGQMGGRGKSSGLELGEMRARGATLYQLREGKVTKLVVYFDTERALADLGLTSEADTKRA